MPVDRAVRRPVRRRDRARAAAAAVRGRVRPSVPVRRLAVGGVRRAPTRPPSAAGCPAPTTSSAGSRTRCCPPTPSWTGWRRPGSSPASRPAASRWSARSPGRRGWASTPACDHPPAPYAGHPPVLAVRGSGDVLARLQVMVDEAAESARLIADLLDEDAGAGTVHLPPRRRPPGSAGRSRPAARRSPGSRSTARAGSPGRACGRPRCATGGRSTTPPVAKRLHRHPDHRGQLLADRGGVRTLGDGDLVLPGPAPRNRHHPVPEAARALGRAACPPHPHSAPQRLDPVLADRLGELCPAGRCAATGDELVIDLGALHRLRPRAGRRRPGRSPRAGSSCSPPPRAATWSSASRSAEARP